MRCLSCDCVLTSREATRKFAGSGTFIDMCGRCMPEIPLDFEYTENPHVPDHDAPEELDNFDTDAFNSLVSEDDEPVI